MMDIIQPLSSHCEGSGHVWYPIISTGNTQVTATPHNKTAFTWVGSSGVQDVEGHNIL